MDICTYTVNAPPSTHTQAVDVLLESQQQKRIFNRQDEYHRGQYRSMMISPARPDPFADGRYRVCFHDNVRTCTCKYC